VSISIEPVLRWVADQVGTSARVVAVKGLRAGAGPWRLGIDHGGQTVEAVLRVGDPDTASRRRLATEAAAWRWPKSTGWQPHGCWPSTLLGILLGGLPC
jgi:hypothetical protein